MAHSPVFDRTCEEVERTTRMSRLEARGTVRIALRTAGLDAATIDAAQMQIVLTRVLPQELAARGVAQPEALCDEIARTIAGVASGPVTDRLAAASRTLERFGGK